MPCCHSENGKIAQWTTPSILYKPSQVEMADVAEIVVVVSQMGNPVITLTGDEANTTEEGFLWMLTQEQTSLLALSMTATVQVDYKTNEGRRYTTMPKTFEVLGSAFGEEI